MWRLVFFSPIHSVLLKENIWRPAVVDTEYQCTVDLKWGRDGVKQLMGGWQSPTYIHDYSFCMLSGALFLGTILYNHL